MDEGVDAGPGGGGSGGVFGRYVLVERLGQRELSQRWLALDLELDRKVALELRAAGDEAKALLDKAAGLARVSHPNVVTIHDVGEAEGQLFIAREYLDGEPLTRWLAAGPYPWQEALAVLRQVGEGLAAIHEAGLVHRSIRPTKIILDRRGRACVLGIGLRAGPSDERGASRASEPLTLDHDDQDARVMRVRSRPGAGRPRSTSPQYRAPELLRGEPGDLAADQFSFCVILFEALYGVRPFAASTSAELIEAIEAGKLIELPADELAPARIHRVIVRGLAADPSARYADMHALLDALADAPTVLRSRSARVVGFGLGGLALAAALASLWPEGEQPCASAGQAIAAAWDPGALRAALGPQLAGDEPRREAGLRRLVDGLDDYAEAWAGAERQLCRDYEAKRTTVDLHVTRTECLARRRAALETATTLDWASPELAAAMLDQPDAVLRSLGDPRRCLGLGTDAARLGRTAAELDASARTRARLLAELEPLGAAAQIEACLAELGERGGDAGEDAELALLRGHAAALAGREDAARAELERATQLAVLDEPSIAAAAWIELAELELAALVEEDRRWPGVIARRTQTIMRSLDYAEAMITDAAAPELLELARVRAELALARAAPELAEPSLTRALASIRGERPSETHCSDLAAALLEVHAELLELDDDDEAAAAARSRAELLREL